MVMKCIYFDLDGRPQYIQMSFSVLSRVCDIVHGYGEDASVNGTSILEQCTTAGPLICCCGKLYSFQQDGHIFELWIMDSILQWLFVDGKAADSGFSLTQEAWFRQEKRKHLVMGSAVLFIGILVTVLTSLLLTNFFFIASGLLVYGGTRLVIGLCMLLCMRRIGNPSTSTLELNGSREVQRQLLLNSLAA